MRKLSLNEKIMQLKDKGHGAKEISIIVGVPENAVRCIMNGSKALADYWEMKGESK